MKTTIEISDPLFERLRQSASEQGVTMRALVERALRQLLEQPAPAFELPDASVQGNGLNPEFEDWSRIRDAIYESGEP